MRHADRHDGVAAGGMRRAAALLLLVAAPLLFAGCHDEQRLRQRLEGPTARLPVEPDQPTTPPAPALLDTVKPWQQPAGFDARTTATWDIVGPTRATGDFDLTYRVPDTCAAREAALREQAAAQPEPDPDAEVAPTPPCIGSSWSTDD